MDSSISSIVTTLGGGSGVDMVKLASDLAEARYAPQIAQYETRNEALETRISAASQLRSQVTELASALGTRIRTGDLAPRPTITNGAVASVSVQAGTSPSGTFSLEVSQLATSQTLALRSFSSSSDPVGEGTLTLRFGTVDGANFTEDTNQTPIDITIDAGDGLDTVASKINAASSSVTAYVANGQAGAQLVLKGPEGAVNGFVLDAQSTGPGPANTPGDLTYLAWSPASDAGELRASAQDAIFQLDTIAMTSASNEVTDLPGGMVLQLTGTNVGAPATIGFASRNDAISGVMGDFVAALNDITSALRELANPLGGELGNDAGARALKRALSGLASEVVMPNAAEDEPSRLADLGLATNRDGSFRLDSERLERTLTENPAATAAMFTTGLFGVFATMDNLARASSAVGDPNSLAGSVNRYTDQIARNDERLAKIADQQARLRENMTKNFAAADRRVAQSQSTLSFLQQQIEIWNSQRN